MSDSFRTVLIGGYMETNRKRWIMSDRITTSTHGGVVISSDCGSCKTHEPHTIRKGFLGFGVRKCTGYTHHHFWKLDPLDLGGRYENKFLFTVNWKCHCGEYLSVSRVGFYSDLVGRPWFK